MTDIAMTAKQIREAGVPDLLNRWLTLTPERLAEDEATRRRNTTQQWRRPMTTKIGAKEQALRNTTAANAKAAEAAPKTETAELNDAQPEATAPDQPQAAKAADTKESAVKKKTTNKTSAKPPKKAAPKAKPTARRPKAPGKAAGRNAARKPKAEGVRPGSKLEAIVGLLKRPQGCTTKQVLAETGWPAVSMPQQARAAGLTLKKEKKDGVTVYRAA